MKPHKHAEIIKAWADGNDIETRCENGLWSYCESPSWSEWVEYRIKQRPDLHFFVSIAVDVAINRCHISTGDAPLPNIQLTFDRETRFLKAAKVLK